MTTRKQRAQNETTPSLRRTRVEFSVVGAECSYAAGVGRVVDLSTPMPGGLTLADVTDPAWFEPLDEAAPKETSDGDPDLNEG